ncbi:hypothetical protein B0H14DRAFT_2678883 [Mycena olivaceomarginata]|nr:hypothetical protein B0H14DRAFT_2678883 [Mycena olivaceomarginata]
MDAGIHEEEAMETVLGNMGAIATTPNFFERKRDHLELLRCSQCKTVRYCGQECQPWHWKNGHKVRCFRIDY